MTVKRSSDAQQHVTNNVNTINNNIINNITNNNIVCIFGKEDLSHITKETMLDCIAKHVDNYDNAMRDVLHMIVSVEAPKSSKSKSGSASQQPRSCEYENKNVSFVEDEHGNYWVLSDLVNLRNGKQIPIFQPMEREKLVKQIAIKGIDVMEQTVAEDCQESPLNISEEVLNERLGEDNFGELDDYMSEVRTIRKVMTNEDIGGEFYNDHRHEKLLKDAQDAVKAKAVV